MSLYANGKSLECQCWMTDSLALANLPCLKYPEEDPSPTRTDNVPDMTLHSPLPCGYVGLPCEQKAVTAGFSRDDKLIESRVSSTHQIPGFRHLGFNGRNSGHCDDCMDAEVSVENGSETEEL